MHLHTLHIEHVYLLSVYTLLTLANTRLHRGMRGVHFFVLYSVLALLGGVAVVLRGAIPDFLSVVIGNVFVIAAYFALYVSMSRLFELSRRQDMLAGAWLTAGIATMVWSGSVHPNTGIRLLAYSAVLAAQQMQLASLLLFGDRARRRMSWMLGGMLIALGIANLYRIGTVLMQGAPQDYRQSGPALAAVVLANSCLQCGVMVAYVWMTAAMLRKRLEVQASTDPLTGLLNRRALEEIAEGQVRSLHAGNAVFCAIQIDLDRYKPINARLGHAAGDQALRAAAVCLRACLRSGDTLARTGGDEFVALLPRTSVGLAVSIAERMRSCLAALDLGLEDQSVHISGSFGVAEASTTDEWDQVVFHCDKALYRAKRQGGNAVRCHMNEDRLEISEVFYAIR